MRAAAVLALAACGSATSAIEPVAPPCSAERIGTVHVTGAARSLVPGLAVLEGTLDDRDRTARIVQAATEALHWRGYAQAQITVARERGCFVDLRVAIALGPRFTIARIDFATADDFPKAARLAAIEDALGTVNTIGGVLIEYRLRRALTGLAKRYRDAGWLDVAIGAPIARYADGAAHVTIPITAGTRYRVGVIRALGATARVRTRLLDELGIEPGAYYDAAAVRRALARVRRTIGRAISLRASADDGLVELEATLR